MKYNNSFITIFDRIKDVTDLKNLQNLAKTVGSTQSTASKKKAKKEFPVEWAYKVGKEYNLLTEWIMEGTGPMRPGGQDENEREIINEIKQWLNEITGEDPDAEEWFNFEIKREIPEFKEWLIYRWNINIRRNYIDVSIYW